MFNFLKKNKTENIVSNKKEMQYPKVFDLVEKVRPLLWFSDGQNSFKTTYIKNEYIHIYLTEIDNDDPCMINTELPIKETNKYSVELDYYPSYSKLAPQERWIYLNWLEDVTKPIDIGFVFIFYYGLERHLYYGNYKEARDMIFLLRKFHNNESFQFYSECSLIISSLLHSDKTGFLQIMQDIKVCNDLHLFAYKTMKVPINSTILMDISKNVGFTNHRYIKDYPSMFLEYLSCLVSSKYENGYISLKSYEFTGTTAFPSCANYSIDYRCRTVEVPSLINNKKFCKDMYNLLNTTHEKVKKELREQRKIKK